MSLNWDSTLSTGIGNIDDQHKELFNFINKLTYAMKEKKSKDEIIKALNCLEEYMIKHFNEEEAIQKQHNYPKFSIQHNQHEEFKSELQRLRNTFETTGISSLFAITVQQKIFKGCRKHIIDLDKDLGEFLIEQYRPKVKLCLEKMI